MKNFIFCLGLFFTTCCVGVEAAERGGSLSSDEEFYKNVDSFYDYKTDYSRFPGRVSDRDASGNVVKVSTENRNVKFFRAGDAVEFEVASQVNLKTPCVGNVRDIEPGYFVMFVKDFFPCWGKEDYFRRGAQLNFHAPILATRVKDASVYRVLLLKRKRDFLRQMNEINHFVWSYDQKRVQLAAEYDQEIADIERKKQKALEFMTAKKRDSILTQKELSTRLDQLDKDIDYYRIERHELLTDRWDLDHDLGIPVGKRPQAMKAE